MPTPQTPLWLELATFALGVPALMFLVGLLLYVLDVANPPGW